MSFSIQKHQVEINQEELIKLFLGEGDLKIPSGDYEVTLNRIFDRHPLNEEEHSIKLAGTSSDPDVFCVDGEGSIKPKNGLSSFALSLELHLQDRFG